MSIVNIHVITGVLKQFLRSLKEPLLTFSLWKSFTSIADMSDEMDVQTTIYSLIPDLPQPNRDTLAYLILHIQRFVEPRWLLIVITSYTVYTGLANHRIAKCRFLV